MRTEGLSINLATVRQQWNFREAVEAACATASRRSRPGATRSRRSGSTKRRAIIQANGLRVTGYCRGGMFPAADAAGRAGRDRRQQAHDRRGRGDRRRLPRADRRRPAARLARSCRRARHGGRRHRGGPAARARRAGAARDRAAASDVRGRPRLREHARARRSTCAMRSARASASRSTSITSGGIPTWPTQIARAGRTAHPRASHLRLAGADQGPAARPRHDGRRRDRPAAHPPHGRGRGLPRAAGGRDLLGQRLVEAPGRRGHQAPASSATTRCVEPYSAGSPAGSSAGASASRVSSHPSAAEPTSASANPRWRDSVRTA